VTPALMRATSLEACPTIAAAAAGAPRPRVPRSALILAHDLAAAAAALALAPLLTGRAGIGAGIGRWPLFLALAGGAFLAFGLHRRIWSCTGLGDLGAVVKAATWAVALFAAAVALAGAPAPPHATIVQWLLLVVLLCGARLAWRLIKAQARRARAVALPSAVVPVLLYGCGPLAALFVGALRATPQSGLRVVGIIEDPNTPRGRRVHDVPVLGPPQELDRILAELAVQGIQPRRLVLTRSALSPAMRALAEQPARHGLELHVLPDLLGLGAAAASGGRVEGGARGIARQLGAFARAVRAPAAAPAAPARPRLLVVNRYFDPDPSATAQLLTDLVEALAPRGFAITVLAGRHDYLATGADLPAPAARPGIVVRRLRHTTFGRFSLSGRGLDGLSFAAAAFLALLARARPGDLILAKSDPPLIAVVAWLAAWLTGARLVNWCQDLFPETAAVMGLPLARGLAGRALKALRNAALRGAETNVAVSAGMAARLAAAGVPRARLTVIPNWADGEAIRPLAPARNPLRAAWGLGERCVIGYSGNLGRAHAVAPIVELIGLLAADPKILFLVIGAGSGHRELRTRLARAGRANVVFQPHQERARLPHSLTAPDLHLVTLHPEWEGLVMPSKLYGALAAGRPVVFIGDPAGDCGRLVGAGPGLVAPPDAMPALAAELQALARDPARLARMGAAARRAYEAMPKAACVNAWFRCLDAAARPAPAALPEAAGAD
jgi:glycosyltransferase involved in cell wall biosynthesis